MNRGIRYQAEVLDHYKESARFGERVIFPLRRQDQLNVSSA